MPIEALSEPQAVQLLEDILRQLRERQLADLASQIAEATATRVVDEIDTRQLEHLSRSVRSELGTKSVRERTAVERLSVALQVLDARLREAPAVAAAAADLLNVDPASIRFEYDETALEVPYPRSDERFSLNALLYEPLEEERVESAFRVLWEAVGRTVEPIHKERSWLP